MEGDLTPTGSVPAVPKAEREGRVPVLAFGGNLYVETSLRAVGRRPFPKYDPGYLSREIALGY